MVATMRLLALIMGLGCIGREASIESGPYEVTSSDLGVIELRRGDDPLLSISAFIIGLVDELDPALSYDPYWLAHEDAVFVPDPPPSLRWRTGESASAEEIDGGLEVTQSFGGALTAVLSIRAGEDGRFSATWVPSSPTPIAWLRFHVRATADEGFYGLGEALDRVEHRGKLVPMQIEPDLSLESASSEHHVPVPLLIGTRGWGVFVESRRFGAFDVARAEDDLVEVTYGTAEESARGLSIHLFGAEHPLDVTRHYYAVTSPPLLPAEWAYGPLIWRDENRDQAEVESDVAMIRDLDLATSGTWIDRPYATAVNTFDFDPAKFPDPAAMIDRAHAAGLRMALWHTPYVEEAGGAIRAAAVERGYFPRRAGIRLNGWSDPIDFTNAEAFAWWQDNIRRYTSMGIEGFKLDYGEDLIPGVGGARTAWEFSDGSTELTMHHDYTLLYHRAYAETLPPSGGFLLCRAGRWGDQKQVSVIWPGDLDASFAKHRERVDDTGGTYNAVGGLPASVVMGLSLGPSGFPFFGADTGGYRHSPPDDETYIRWFEQTALSTVMQVGDSSSEPPWVFTPENGRGPATLDLYRTFARLHLRLFPYVWSYAKRIAEDGRPIQRALGLAHPELGVHPSDAYLMGDHLFVAPVLERGARTKHVIFPPGDWIDFFDGSTHRGEETVGAPLEKLPLYVRAGGIVPMLRPTIDTIAPATQPGIESYANDAGVLHVVIAYGPGATFALFDGTSISHDGSTLQVSSGSTFTAGFRIERLGWPSTRPPIDVPPGSHTIVIE
jgi:alpha-D-xyloside xylohydrolase